MDENQEVEPWIKEIIDTYDGVALYRKKYSRYSESWDHDHCDICSQKLMEAPGQDIENEGYSTDDSYNWICIGCANKYGPFAKWILK